MDRLISSLSNLIQGDAIGQRARWTGSTWDVVDSTAIDPRDYGALGDGTGRTIADVGADLAAIQAASGQTWLTEDDSMDLVGFYLAQVSAEQTGRGIAYQRGNYVHTAQGYIHPGVHIDGGGSFITSIAVPDGEGIAAPFSMGLFGRYDIPRFETQGWTFLADDITAGDPTLTGFTGTTPEVGDVLLIHTTANDGGTPILPDYTTFNEVASAVGTTITLRWPMEKDMVAPKIVNYNKITTKKSDLVPGSAPHVYYCCAHASIRNVTLSNLDGGSVLGASSLLDCDIDVRSIGNVQSVYFNGLNRCRVNWGGEFGGARGFEIAVGSALSSINVDLKFNGDATDYTGASSASYNLFQFAEHSHATKVTGRIDAGAKPCAQGLVFQNSDNNVVDLQLTALDVTQSIIAFSGDTRCANNRASGMYDLGTASGISFASWSSGGGDNNWLDGVTFVGDPSGTAVLFSGPSRGGARGISVPNGTLAYSGSSNTGNVVIDSYIADGVSSGTLPLSTSIKTSTGSWPEIDVIADYNANTTLFNRQQYGRTLRNATATAIRTIPLAACVAGMWLRAYRDNASFAFRLNPNGTNVIGTGGAGKYLSLDSDGAFVVLRCYKDGIWVIESSDGTITMEP